MGLIFAKIEIDIHLGINPVRGGSPPIDISKIGKIHDMWGDSFIIEGACEFEWKEDLINKINNGVTTTTYIIKYIEVYMGFPT